MVQCTLYPNNKNIYFDYIRKITNSRFRLNNHRPSLMNNSNLPIANHAKLPAIHYYMSANKGICKLFEQAQTGLRKWNNHIFLH